MSSMINRFNSTPDAAATAASMPAPVESSREGLLANGGVANGVAKVALRHMRSTDEVVGDGQPTSASRVAAKGFVGSSVCSTSERGKDGSEASSSSPNGRKRFDSVSL